MKYHRWNRNLGSLKSHTSILPGSNQKHFQVFFILWNPSASSCDETWKRLPPAAPKSVRRRWGKIGDNIFFFFCILTIAPPVCFVSSRQPGGVQSQRLPHLCGPDQSSESGCVLCLQLRECDHLELSGRGGNGALPNSATVRTPGTWNM